MDEINTSTIGERIRLLRKRKGMSQIELAAAIHKSTRTVQKYENGEIEVSQFVAHQLAKVLDSTPTYLLGYETSNASLVTLADVMDYFFKLEEIAELDFQIEVKKPPRNDGWYCSITFNGKDQAKFNADMCLFLENWADERKRRVHHKEEYEQWQKDTLAYYAANPVTEKPEPESSIPSGYTYYEGEGLRKTKVEDLKREYYGLD